MDHTVVFLLMLLSATAYTTAETYASIRLANGRHRCEGRVEVFFSQSWGTVCDDLWNINNARVVCRELECGDAMSAPGSAWFGQGSGRILLDNVVCTGNEFHLDQCTHRGWGINDCSHHEDAGVICSERPSVTERRSENYACGQTFSDAFRSFIGPYYNGDRNVIECLWTIQSNDYTPIQITLDYVELDCNREYINIYNGQIHHSTLLGKICNGSSSTFVSFSGTMSVLLHRDSYNTGPGFFAYYEIRELESTTHPESTGISGTALESIPPGVPLSTLGPELPGSAIPPSTVGAERTSSASSPETMTPTAIPPSTVGTERTSSAVPLSTGGAELTSPAAAGTTLEPVPETTSILTVCGGILTAPSGYISAPYYPGNGLRMECTWEIQAASYDRIVLDFYYISYNLNCRTDYIEIYDGVLGSRKLGRICSDSHYVYKSTSSIITVVLYRNAYQPGDSFTAYYYSSLAVSTLPPLRTESSSPETMTPTGIPLSTGAPELPSSGIPLSTGAPELPSSAIPPSTVGAERTSSGFHCGGILTAPRGDIYAPYYPGNGVEMECIWEIQTAPYDRVVLDVYYVDYNLNCRTDFIVIYDGNFGARQLARICSTPSHLYTSTSNIMTIVLYRNSYLSSQAFSAYYYSSPSASALPPAINETAAPAPATTEFSVNQCGGNISLPFGSISGPYYPGNSVSVQCVWEIEVSPLHHIILQFSSIRLDCNKEYVEIFDGRLYSPYLIGRICSGIYLNYTYTSTSNTITILLHRDSDLSGYGFDAYYYSVQEVLPTSIPPHNETAVPATNSTSAASRSLSCSGEYMIASIRRTYLRSLGYDAWEVYLNSSDFFCRPQITLDYVIFNIPFSGCGTVRQEKNNETIIYSNIIKTSASGYIITRKRNFQFHIMCEMNENTIVETMFVAKNSVDITETKDGTYDITLALYESQFFSHKIHSSPYYVSINQELYFQATLNSSDSNLVLFMDTCKASPDANDFTTLTYDLIRSGCVRDSTYRSLYSSSNNAVRFKINAFKFLNQHNEVYLQCNLVVCMANDYSSRCYQGCLSRKKRNADEDQDKVNVVVGPFKLVGKAKEEKSQELVKSVNPGKEEAVNPLTVATVLLAAMVFVLSGFLLSSKLRRKNYQQIY